MNKTINKKRVLIVIAILFVISMAVIFFISRKIPTTQASSIVPVEEENEIAEQVPNDKEDENIIADVETEKPAQTNGDSNQETSKKQDDVDQEADKKGVIYLTFDDGPSLDSTPKILDILKEENVKATFFLLNYTSAKEKLVKREVEEGNSIGIHGYSHKYKKIYQSEDAYMENLNKMQSKIEKSTGIKTTLTRFPGGSSNTISRFNKGIMTKLTQKVQEEGYQYYDWNVDSGDAGGAKNEKQVYNNVINSLSKKRSNVVLMHDFSNNEKTIKELKKIIQYGKENGYEFRRITADCGLVMHHNVLN